MTQESGGHAYMRDHTLRDQLLAFDLGAEAARLRREAQGDRRGEALVKDAGLNIVLTTLARGAALAEHTTRGATSILVVDGRVRLRAGGRETELPAGSLGAVDAGVEHSVVAEEDSAILVSVAAPGD